MSYGFHLGLRLGGRRAGGPTLSFTHDFSGGSLPAGVTLGRASTGTFFDAAGVMQSAAVDAARFDHHPSTLAALGLLVEAARTNLLTRSAEFGGTDHAVYDGGATSTPTVNNATAPDGTTTATRVVRSAVAVGAYSMIYHDPVTLNLAPHAVAYYLKGAVGGEQVYIISQDGGSINRGTLCTLTTAWQRFVHTFTPTQGGGGYVGLGNHLGIPGQQATAAGTLYAWGGELVEAATVGSHVPTVAATATRAADVAGFTIPAGVSSLVYTFDDDTTQTVAVSPGAYVVPTNLDRAWIKTIEGWG